MPVIRPVPKVCAWKFMDGSNSLATQIPNNIAVCLPKSKNRITFETNHYCSIFRDNNITRVRGLHWSISRAYSAVPRDDKTPRSDLCRFPWRVIGCLTSHSQLACTGCIIGGVPITTTGVCCSIYFECNPFLTVVLRLK